MSRSTITARHAGKNGYTTTSSTTSRRFAPVPPEIAPGVSVAVVRRRVALCDQRRPDPAVRRGRRPGPARRRRPRHPRSLRRRCPATSARSWTSSRRPPGTSPAADRAAGGPCPRLRASPGASARSPAPGSGTCTGPAASTAGGTTGSPWPTAARRSPRSPTPAPGPPSTPKPVACAGWPTPSPCPCRTSSAGTTAPSCSPGYRPAAPIRTRPARSAVNWPGCTPPARTASARRGRGSSRACRWTTPRGRRRWLGRMVRRAPGAAVPAPRRGRRDAGPGRCPAGGDGHRADQRAAPARGSRRAASTATAGPAT